MNKPRTLFTLATLVLAIGIGSLTGCWSSGSDGEAASKSKNYQGLIERKREATRRINQLIDSEDLVLDLTQRISSVASWMKDRSQGKEVSFPIVLAECRETVGLAAADLESVFHADPDQPDFVQAGKWPLASESDAGTNPWQALDSLDADWQTMKFGVVAGDFLDDDPDRFLLHTKVEGSGKSRAGETPTFYGLKGVQDLTFRRQDDGWVLASWQQEEMKLIRSRHQPFQEVLADILPDPDSLARAQRSYMDEIILKTSETGKFALPDMQYEPWSTMTADHVFPSVAVLDYNNDDWDDLFLTARWGPTQLLENQGDGTYREVTREAGLEFDFLVNCALFVDLDNDGDCDALIGRSMEPSRYFRNDDGKFVDVSAELSDFDEHPLYFVSSISASDVNRDGLLDIYLSTYPVLAKGDTGFEDKFLNEFEKKKYLELRDANAKWVDTPGTPNVLLMNRGDGKLERVDYDDALSQWRRSYQAVWGDIDSDGDDDLYICNDFAPDALLRNDTPTGAPDPVFVDVTDQWIATDGVGFGMGASYGDFDRDGDLDLYVSNMFSKAGNRIFQKLDSVDPRIRGAAAGCFLFVNQDGSFAQSAGSDASDFAVNQVGWSYGGQWSDLDNDGQLDLYVPTGFFTAPHEIATQVDL